MPSFARSEDDPRKTKATAAREQRLATEARSRSRRRGGHGNLYLFSTRRDAVSPSPLHGPARGAAQRREAARKLRCSPKTLDADVAAGSLRYVQIGHGTRLDFLCEERTRKFPRSSYEGSARTSRSHSMRWRLVDESYERLGARPRSQ